MTTRATRDEIQPFSSERHLHIVAVTACATGVAHTYMAAEQLEKLAKQYHFAIKIETRAYWGLRIQLPIKIFSSLSSPSSHPILLSIILHALRVAVF